MSQSKYTVPSKPQQGTTARAPSASTGRPPCLERHYLYAAGSVRSYCLYTPQRCRRGARSPLVINLHAICEDAHRQERLSRMARKAERESLIVAYPEALGEPPVWQLERPAGRAADLGFLRALVEHLYDRGQVDAARVFVAGLSNGAGMAHLAGLELADMVAAIACVAGAYPPRNGCEPSRPVPVVAFHGTADRVVPYAGLGRALPGIRAWAAAWAQRNGCRPQPTTRHCRGALCRETWQDEHGKARVVLHTIEGGGHDWPGSPLLPPDAPAREVCATDIIWDFFSGWTSTT